MSSLQLIQNVLLYGVLIYMVTRRGMSIADFVLYTGLVATFSTATTDLFSTMIGMHLDELLMDDFRTLQDWTQEKPDAGKGEGTVTDIRFDQYEFTFENVSFHYPGSEKDVLKNLNLKIEAGTKLAVVGLNGAGKTTFVKLLCRLYEVSEGEILLNGININRFRYRDYIRLLSVVFQDYKLMAFSILDNISLGDGRD